MKGVINCDKLWVIVLCVDPEIPENLGGPSPKAKYDLATDSEKVL